MSRWIRHCQAALFAVGWVAAYGAMAQKEGEEEPIKLERPSSVLDDPLQGIIVNRTVTVVGNDFYQTFSRWWKQQDGENRYTISVHERPTARFGSEVWVEYRRERVFHMFLSPARQAARDIGEQAAEIVYENVVNSEIQRMLVQSEDLGPEEL